MQLTPENQTKLDEIVKRYPAKRSAILPALHIAQEQEGYLSREVMEHVAALLDLTPAQVHDAASYYSMFRFKLGGKTHIEICTNLSCALAGADGLVESTCRKLGVGVGETTADGRFTMVPIVCLGACDHAPTLRIDGDLHHDVDPARIDGVLEKYA